MLEKSEFNRWLIRSRRVSWTSNLSFKAVDKCSIVLHNSGEKNVKKHVYHKLNGKKSIE